jgi:hypothetical protein
MEDAISSISGTVVVAIISALIGFVVWAAQKSVERRSTERLRKEELYNDLLAASVELFATGDGAPFVIESQRAWLYASDEVVQAINDYLKAYGAYAGSKQRGIDSTETWTAVKEAEGILRLHIRKDLHPETKVSTHWVSEKWEFITARPERIKDYLQRE